MDDSDGPEESTRMADEGSRADLELMTSSALASLLDQVAEEVDSWNMLWLRLHERLGLGIALERGVSRDSPVAVAMDAMEYVLSFESSRVALLPRTEAVDSTWPQKVEQAGASTIAQWRIFAAAVQDPAVRARFHHLLFQAKAGNGRVLAEHAVEGYLLATTGTWGSIAKMDYLHAALRLSLAVGDRSNVDLAAQAIRAHALGCAADSAPGIAARGAVILAAVEHLPFDFGGFAEELLSCELGENNADHAYSAWIARVHRTDRDPLWRRRVRAAIDAAEAAEGLLRVSKLYKALHLAEASGIPGLRRNVAARLQRAGRDEFDMMHFNSVTRSYEEALAEAAEAMIRGESLGKSLIRWAAYGPPTGDTERSREITQQSLEGMVFWSLMPVELIGPDHLPMYRGNTEAERFDVEVARYENLVLDHQLPIMTRALRLISEQHSIPDQASLMGFLLSWPSLDRVSARMAANALVRFWAGDFDGALYTIVPQIERTARNLLLKADEGIYRRQRETTPGQYMGLGALLGPLGRLYGMNEDWQRYYELCLNHPAGPNLRNLVSHGFAGQVGPDAPVLAIHLLLHLGMLDVAERDPGFNAEAPRIADDVREEE